MRSEELFSSCNGCLIIYWAIKNSFFEVIFVFSAQFFVAKKFPSVVTADNLSNFRIKTIEFNSSIRTWNEYLQFLLLLENQRRNLLSKISPMKCAADSSL